MSYIIFYLITQEIVEIVENCQNVECIKIENFEEQIEQFNVN